jgi:hypothetical protein
MPNEKLIALIDQLLAADDLQKQKAILAEVSKLLREERERRKVEKAREQVSQ